MSLRGVAVPDSTEDALRVSAALDVRFHRLRGDAMVTDKDEALRELFRVLEAAGVRYALIGGVAVQLWRREPRTTLDIDVAVAAYGDVPAAALSAAGFERLGRYPHSENWLGPGRVPIQFTADPAYAPAIEGAVVRTLRDGGVLRVASALELVHAKLRAASDPERRRSKRLLDLADAEGLLEDQPDLASALTDGERRLLERAI